MSTVVVIAVLLKGDACFFGLKPQSLAYLVGLLKIGRARPSRNSHSIHRECIMA